MKLEFVSSRQVGLIHALFANYRATEIAKGARLFETYFDNDVLYAYNKFYIMFLASIVLYGYLTVSVLA